MTELIAHQVAAPPLPEAPPTVPETQTQAQAQAQATATAKKDRRVLRAALRWTAAVVVFAAVGTAAAYGVTRLDRTDVPGLATASDGRWDYPEISRPPLPAGRPGSSDRSNRAGAHYADLRALVLPAPKGAKADPALRGEDGWLPTKTFLAEYVKDDREPFGQLLTDNGLRHIAARGWTTPDGTRTRVYLLQFSTAAVVDELFVGKLTSYDTLRYELSGSPEMSADDDGFPVVSEVEGVERVIGDEAKPYGAEHVRQAYLGADDTVAVIVQSRKGTAKKVPFQQTVVLQSQLLG
ncbi:hypothetical protein C6Y14_04905 [Streptomyces dioscori]|uniref:Uncharacterized protein n=1 Tax=Streptomyces dioscori TaxID=2109333 RepID=A0A2P8QDQ0_9ACTN|nr:hypothetical protein [Streptomyces dioscori]PSM44382.1 hypothetical protein C6Y14_04905 [Streptomyces dioscori]